MLGSEGFHAEVVGAEPVLDEGVGGIGFGAPGWHDEAVIDSYVWGEGGAETNLVLVAG